MEKQPKVFFAPQQELQYASLNSCCSSLAWLLGALSKRWGIMQLPARLDLQQALLAAEGDSAACYILIQAGARISRPLISKSGINAGPAIWTQAYLRYGLCWSLPDIFLPALTSEYPSLLIYGLDDLDSQLLFEVVAAMLKARPDSHARLKVFLDKSKLQRQRERWSPEQVRELALLAAMQKCVESLLSLLQLPAAQHISTAGELYSDVFILMFQQDFGFSQQLAACVLPRVQWNQQLIDRLVAALRVQQGVKEILCEQSSACAVCVLLDAVAKSHAVQQLPLTFKIELLRAASGFHEWAAKILLSLVLFSAGIATPQDAADVLDAAIGAWPERDPGGYGETFAQLLEQPAFQQLAAAQAQQLLVRAAAARSVVCAHLILAYVPAARALTVEGLQQVLAACIEGNGNTYRGVCISSRIAESGMPAVQQLGQQEVQLLMVKCVERDDGMMLQCLMNRLPAAKQVPLAAVCDLMLQAAAAGAKTCLAVLLQLVPQLQDIPLPVLQQVLPLLMEVSCSSPSLTPESVVGNDQNMCTATTCSVCALLANAADKLAAADVWEVLVAAARAPVLELHLEGLACLPGVDELGEEQVEQLLMAAIEMLPLGNDRGQQPLFRRLEQLQGELLFTKQLPVAAVHRLMVACVGKAVQGGVARPRKVRMMPVDGSSGGQLSGEQLWKLLLVAVQCSIKQQHSQGGENVAECRPCLLVLAKLLPSVRQKQQLIRIIKEAGRAVCLMASE